mgnify:CR=1 FL=1
MATTHPSEAAKHPPEGLGPRRAPRHHHSRAAAVQHLPARKFPPSRREPYWLPPLPPVPPPLEFDRGLLFSSALPDAADELPGGRPWASTGPARTIRAALRAATLRIETSPVASRSPHCAGQTPSTPNPLVSSNEMRASHTLGLAPSQQNARLRVRTLAGVQRPGDHEMKTARTGPMCSN